MQNQTFLIIIQVGPSLSGVVEEEFLHLLFSKGVLQWFDAVSVHGYSCSSQLEGLIDAHNQLNGIIRTYESAGKPVRVRALIHSFIQPVSQSVYPWD